VRDNMDTYTMLWPYCAITVHARSSGPGGCQRIVQRKSTSNVLTMVSEIESNPPRGIYGEDVGVGIDDGEMTVWNIT
jgi:hypothetical protein